MSIDGVPQDNARGDGEGYASRTRTIRDRNEAAAGMPVGPGDDRDERTEESLLDQSQPRTLMPDERQIVRETIAPLLHDLGVTGMRLPDVREEARYDCPADHVCAWIQEPNGQGASGISILTLVPQALRVSLLAEQIQNWAADQLHDAGRLPEWPVCPDHSAGGRAFPRVTGESPVWICAETGHVISTIGYLPG
jgi:hypothetical protein